MSMYFPFGDRPLSIILFAAYKMKSCLSWLWIWFAKSVFILRKIYPTMLLCWTIILHPSKHAGSLLTDQHSSKSTAQNAASHLLPKLQSPAQAPLHLRLSAPLYRLPQSVPVQFLHPGTQPEVLLPLERWQCIFWEAARCWLILGRSWFFLCSGWTNRVLAKQASEFSFCLAHKTEWGFVLWNLTWR